MLFAPPPGYSPFVINRQAPAHMAAPGYQGAAAQGYAPGSSGFSAPSGQVIPGAAPAPGPAPLARPGGGPLAGHNVAALMRALHGGR